MDIYEALSSDHRTFEAQLDQLLTAAKSNDPSWKTIADELRRGLVAHSHAEEALLYNALREHEAGRSLVAHSYSEHAMAEGEIRTLSLGKVTGHAWTSVIEKLSQDLRHHIQEEETKIFGVARKVLSDGDAMRLGEAFTRLKAEMQRDGDSMMASTLDLITNLLPPRVGDSVREHVRNFRKAS